MSIGFFLWFALLVNGDIVFVIFMLSFIAIEPDNQIQMDV